MRNFMRLGLVVVALSARAVTAQPEDFIDLGRRVVQETIVVPIHLDFAEDVQWVRIELPTVTADAGFVDMWTRVEEWTPTDLLIPAATLYDSVGRDLVGVVGPGEWVAALVPALDESGDGCDEFFDAVEGSTSDGLSGDDPEEDLDEVEPGP